MVAADLFDPATAEAIAERLVRVLAAVAADPAGPVHQVQVLDAAERQQVLAGWNDTAVQVPGSDGAGAVRGAGGRGPRMRWRWRAVAPVLSYGELDAAGSAAGALPAGRRGAGPEPVVAVAWTGRPSW